MSCVFGDNCPYPKCRESKAMPKTDRHAEYDRKAAELGKQAWDARLAMKAAEAAMSELLDAMLKLRIEYLEGK